MLCVASCVLCVVVCCHIRIKIRRSDKDEDCCCVLRLVYYLLLFNVTSELKKIRCSDEDEDCCCVLPHPNSSLGELQPLPQFLAFPGFHHTRDDDDDDAMIKRMMTKVMVTKVMITMGDTKGRTDIKCQRVWLPK